MRLFINLYILLLLCGCASQTLPPFLIPPDQQLFIQGMEKVNARGEIPDAFASLQKSYPKSPWTKKAQAISKLLTTIRNHQKSINRLEHDYTSCKQENKVLQQRIKSLENDREKLKQLLIDLERRGG